MDRYLALTDWAVIESVRQWPNQQNRIKKRLGKEWARILNRDVKWKMAYSTLLPTTSNTRGRVTLNRTGL